MNSDHVLRDALSKVPPATLAFRIVKSFAATVGKTVAALDSRIARPIELIGPAFFMWRCVSCRCGRAHRIPEMPMSRFSTLVLLAVTTLAACSKKEPATTDTMPPAALPSDTGATAASAMPTSAAAATTPVSDATILTKEDGGDSAEVVIGKFAQSYASDAQVKAYAAELVKDHSKGQQEVKSLMKKLSLSPQRAPDDTSAQATEHTLAKLGALKGADFDTAFVKHEVEDHKSDIEDAKKMQASASNSEVKALIQKSLPELQKHLSRAEALDKRLGAKRK